MTITRSISLNEPEPEQEPEIPDFPDIFNIERIGDSEISPQIGFTIGVEYVGKGFYRLS